MRFNLLKFLLALVLACAFAHTKAAPRLKAQAEVLVEGALKAKVLENSRGIPPATPQASVWRRTRGTEMSEIKIYEPVDLWRQRAEVGTWEDKSGNVMKVGRVLSLVPEMERMECTKDAVEKKLAEMEANFTGSEAELSAWKRAWGDSGRGEFVKARGGGLYWVEFRLKENLKESEIKNLFRVFERSLVANTRGTSGAVSSMKWWEMKDGKYRFLTNLGRVRGEKTIKDSLKLMAALRKGFEFYVPPQKDIDVCTVRVFATLAEYREYRSTTGANDTMSCGLWDPSRDELLVVAENPERAQETMRHESFHQYLHYATGRGDHAMWFNEGHATFFESVKHLQVKGTVSPLDSGSRAEWVNRNPVHYANQMAATLKMTREEFYSGKANDHYVTAWAIVYFLERGAYTAKEFEPYRGIPAKYLELMGQGASAEEATRGAWALAEGRNLAEDFLKFWRTKRKAALTARETLLQAERKRRK